AANQFLLAGTYINQVSGVANSAQTLAAFPTALNWYGAGSPFYILGGLDYLYALSGGSKTNQYQLSDDLVKTRGKHKFGFGVNFLRTHWTGNGYNFSGTGELVPQSIDAFFSGGVDPSNPVTDFTALYQTYPAVTWNPYAFYSLGLYDPDQPYDKAILINQKQAYPNTDSIVWSPRFSFAWQPLGVSHNTVIRGGAGIFYDPVPGIVKKGLSYNPPLVNLYFITGYNLAPGETNSLSQIASNSNVAFTKGFATGQTLAQIQAADPNFTPPSFYTPANTIHSPQYQKWSLQAQQ